MFIVQIELLIFYVELPIALNKLYWGKANGITVALDEQDLAFCFVLQPGLNNSLLVYISFFAFNLFVIKYLREEYFNFIACSKWVTAVLTYGRLITENINDFFSSVAAQAFDTCNYYNTFEKETHAGNRVISEGDRKQLLPYLCAKTRHWWFLNVKQRRWGWLAESYIQALYILAWCTNEVPTIPTLTCKKCGL